MLEPAQFGANPHWLSDSRRLLFHHAGNLYLVDSQSGNAHEVLSVAPYEADEFYGISRDDRLIVFGFVLTEADVWMMEEQ